MLRRACQQVEQLTLHTERLSDFLEIPFQSTQLVRVADRVRQFCGDRNMGSMGRTVTSMVTTGQQFGAQKRTVYPARSTGRPDNTSTLCYLSGSGG